MARKLKIGFVFPGHVRRIAPQIGFCHAMHLFRQQVSDFPKPEIYCGVSGGGISSAIAVQDSEAHFVKWELLYSKVTRSSIAGINPDLLIRGGAAAILSLAPLRPLEMIKSRKIRYLVRVLLASSELYADEAFVDKLLKCNSIFSADKRLRRLFNNLDFDAIFNSDIKLQIAAANISTNEYSVVTNYKPEHRNKDLFIEGLIDTTRLPVFFGFRKNRDGHYVGDGAGIANMPLDLVVNHGCDVVVILGFTYPKESLAKEYNMWIAGLQRFIDMITDTVARKDLEGFERINNALTQVEGIQKELVALDTIACEAGLLNRGLASELSGSISRIEEYISRFSCIGKKKVKIISVDSVEPIDDYHFTTLTPEKAFKGYNQGCNAFTDSFLPQYLDFIKTAD